MRQWGVGDSVDSKLCFYPFKFFSVRQGQELVTCHTDLHLLLFRLLMGGAGGCREKGMSAHPFGLLSISQVGTPELSIGSRGSLAQQWQGCAVADQQLPNDEAAPFLPDCSMS